MLKRVIAVIAAAIAMLTASSVIKPVTIKTPTVKTTVAASSKVNKSAYYPISHNEYTELCKVVMAESGGESYKGQMAVAQCILNTCLIEHIRPVEVVKTHGYTKWRPEPTESVKNAVIAVFTDGVTVLDKRVTIFYSPKNVKNGYSKYHESQIYSCTIGGHKFFIERRNA